jgi:hypothetical protein
MFNRMNAIALLPPACSEGKKRGLRGGPAAFDKATATGMIASRHMSKRWQQHAATTTRAVVIAWMERA